MGEGLEYRPFCDLRSVPEASSGGNRLKIMEGPTLRSFSYVKQSLGFFHFLEIVTVWLVRSTGQKIPIQPGWYLPLQKIPLAENRFLQAGIGAKNTKEKIQAVLYGQRTGLKPDSVWTHDEWWQVQDVGPQDSERQFQGVDWVEVQVRVRYWDILIGGSYTNFQKSRLALVLLCTTSDIN
jgi:hypothetical protein